VSRAGVNPVLVCWNCGADLADIPRPISRHATCPACFNELHCCRLCRNYDADATTTCHEDRADPPLQKENDNFCDFFTPRAAAFEASVADRSAQARNDLDALFSAADAPTEDTGQADDDSGTATGGDADIPDKEALARRKLDDLFK